MKLRLKKLARLYSLCCLLIGLLMICVLFRYWFQGMTISYARSNQNKYTTMYLVMNTIGNLDNDASDDQHKAFHMVANETGVKNTTVIFREKTTDNHEENVISAARKVSEFNRTVMLTFVNDAYLPFAYSWLCNTKDMGIHKSVLVVTNDQGFKDNITSGWPEVTVVVVETDLPRGDQEYSHVGYLRILIGRTEIIMLLLLENYDVMLFEFDYVWFANPIPEFQTIKDVDILVNPVSLTTDTFNGGLIYLFATDRTKSLWGKLTDMMKNLGERISKDEDSSFVSESENDQHYLSRLINETYAGIQTRVLPLDRFADGVWYKLSASDRSKTHPILISNNWIIGNKNKISRAKEWKHWFVKDDNTCNDELVSQTVHK